MGLFDFFKRRTGNASERSATPATNSRIEYLLAVHHDMLEGRRESSGGQNFFELVEQQIAEGRIDLAVDNLAWQAKDCFEIADLYWGQGDLERAEAYLRKTLERNQRRVAVTAQHAWPHPPNHPRAESCIKAAAVLLDAPLAGAGPTTAFEMGYQPWFENTLLDACLGVHDFDQGAWHAAEDAWLKRRFSRSRLKDYQVYVKALTGGFASDADMLAAHDAMFTARGTKSIDGDLLDGYQDNALIVDHIFAAILQRIGWAGTYRHSWPGTAPVGTPAVTTRAADRRLRLSAAPSPAPDATIGIIADPRAARRFIDLHVAEQRDHWEQTLRDAGRPAKEAGKVAKVLKELGWENDPDTLDLMRAYRVDAILNDSTHLFLSDPIGDRFVGLKTWTAVLSEFGLHPDFIPVAESEEKSDYTDPQGAWYVRWKTDRRIYAVQREDWDRPEVATSNARLGKEVWPSYVSFVAWWVAEHRAFKR